MIAGLLWTAIVIIAWLMIWAGADVPFGSWRWFLILTGSLILANAYLAIPKG